MPPKPKEGNTEGAMTTWEWVCLIAFWPVALGIGVLLAKALS